MNYKEHAEGLQRDYDLLLAEYNALKNHQKQEPVAKVVLTERLRLPCLQWLDLDRQFDFQGGEFLYLAPQLGLAWTQQHWTEYEHNIVAAEREACAQIADSWKTNVVWENKMIATNLAKEIRARGKA